jgi:hypothetical protein
MIEAWRRHGLVFEPKPTLPGRTYAATNPASPLASFLRGFFVPGLLDSAPGVYLYVAERHDNKWVAHNLMPEGSPREPFDTPEEVLLWLQMQGYQ